MNRNGFPQSAELNMNSLRKHPRSHGAREAALIANGMINDVNRPGSMHGTRFLDGNNCEEVGFG